MFCPECGVDHHADDREVQAAADREVEIARIHAERDIKVAQISARDSRDWNETRVEVAAIEAEAEVESAAAEATVIATILDNDSDSGQEQEPVIFDAPPAELPELDPTDDAAPPPVEDHEPGDDKARKRGLGMWGS